MRIIVFGARGWIGSQLLPVLRALPGEPEVVEAPPGLRADDEEQVLRYLSEEVREARRDRVVSLIGRTHGPGFPTIDYLEQPGKLHENLRDNLFAPAVLASVCAKLGAHYTYLGTGCIFSDDGRPPPGQARRHAYGPDAQPDFFGSSYSSVKGVTDRLLPMLSRTVGARLLNVRIRMPITADLAPRSFITKITRYERVCSVANSMSVLPTLLPALADLVRRGHVGTVNLVNPGCISHDQILTMYRELVDPAFRWANFSIAEQDAVLASRRSNNVLDTAWIEREYPWVPDIHEAVRACLQDIAAARAPLPSAATPGTP